MEISTSVSAPALSHDDLRTGGDPKHLFRNASGAACLTAAVHSTH